MTGRMRNAVWAGLGFAVVVGSPAAAQQTRTICDQQQQLQPPTASAPAKVQATVVKIDATTGTVTLQDQYGRTYEFHGSRSALRDVKVGEPLEARLRQGPTC